MRIACVQCNVSFGEPLANAGFAFAELERLSQEGVDLAIFPEAFLTGYCVCSEQEADAIAIIAAPEDDRSPLGKIRLASEQWNITAVVGFAERSREGDRRYNSAVLFERGQPPRIYRKSHLPCLGLDKFVTPGDGLPVFDTKVGKIGILICFDQRVPEAARVLALKGAEMIALPTNWPEGAESSADHVCIARAAENRVFFATANRVGTENGFTFIGRSKIIDPAGKVLSSAGAGAETIIADIDLAEARNKRTVVIPGQYEYAVFESRRPELYGAIIEP